MKIKSYCRFLLLSILNILMLVIVCATLWAGYRIWKYTPSDNQEMIAGKHQYLEQLNTASSQITDRPNIIFVLYDDMGYGDIGVGAPNGQLINTPNLDQLAANGVSFINFYAPSASCTPSRAAFLTGRMPVRANMPYVVFPSGSKPNLIFNRLMQADSSSGLPSEEITMAEILQAAGYRTGMIGKWHLGDRQPSLPNDFGFEQFFGSLYSNDMTPFELYRNRQVEHASPIDQRKLSALYDKEVVNFIEADSDQPFFLYLAHNFPHDPLYVTDERNGQSKAGLFGDVLEELDDGIGNLMAALERTNKLDNTLIVITSDNGPWFLGNTGGHRGRKGNTFDGGMKVPFIAHWPATIPGGRVEPAITMGMDLMPTVLDILGLPAPQDRVLDGKSIRKVLTQGDATPHAYLYYYEGRTLFAVRDQRFKYRAAKPVLYGTDELSKGVAVPQKESLFDLESDPAETYDVSNRHPKALVRLRMAYQQKSGEVKQNPRGWLYR